MDKQKVIVEMKQVYKDRPQGIEHTLRVLNNAEVIMAEENLSDQDQELIAIAAILHDIGIPRALEKYGSSKSTFQEQEGGVIARSILEKLGYDSDKTDRVCYIVGNHHTKSKIDGLDFQIIWEADLLVNLENMEISKTPQKLEGYIKENFKTQGGLKLIKKEF